MPSPDDLGHDFDDFHEDPATKVAPTVGSEGDPWGFEKQQPGFKKKKSKTKKKNVAAKPIPLVDQDDDDDASSAYAVPITPSPPVDGVKLQVSRPVAEPAPYSHSPLSGFEDDTTAFEDEEPPPPPSPKPPPRLPASVLPAVRSPRPVPVRPAAAASPPTRPASLSGPYEPTDPMAAYRHNPQPRRESFLNPALPRPKFVEPPPPHMPQPHFFGLPDLGFGFGQKQESGRPAGTDGYCCTLDSLADAGDGASAKKAKDALLVGSEGGLDVFRLLSNKLEVVGRIEGLRGSVIGAKILPHTDRDDPLQQARPLIALIIHGPVASGHKQAGRIIDDFDSVDDATSGFFSTTVDIFSLQSQQHIATLYESTPVAAGNTGMGLESAIPEPVGDLWVSAEGHFITVASGKSGEIFVFTATPITDQSYPDFRCLGKFWTSVQTSISGSRPTSANDSFTDARQSQDDLGRPLYSLSQRWLAITPPALSSTISIQGSPLLSDANRTPPGLSSHVAPPQHIITCEVIGTDVEGTWTRVSKAAAQGLFKYSQKGIEMGLQGWKELTHPSPPPSGRNTHDRRLSKDDSLFPPTKGPSDDPARLKNEPALVSIIDLESLLQWEEHRPKYAPPPMATFALLGGCNFLSFSTTGTRLLTSSRKGEVSTIWDLAQAAHGISKHDTRSGADAVTSPCVKQLHRITRNTPSMVLDSAWSRDDDALAILTAHGTVHLHEIPTRPVSQKRKRRNPTNAPAEKAEATLGLSTGLSPPSSNQGFLGSIKSGWQTVSTQVNSIRSTNPASALGLPTTFAGFRDATAAAGTAGSRAVAKGLSQGFTAAKGGASDYWHADDNKIRHKSLQDLTSASALRWVRRNNVASLAIVCGGTVYTHHIQRVTRRKGDDIVTGLKNERYAQKSFALPPITTRAELDTAKCAIQGPHGFWSLRHSTPPPQTVRRISSQPSRVSHGQINDVETNPPYCPFHADPRTNVYAYNEHDQGSQFSVYEPSASYADFLAQGHSEEEGPWSFGEPLPSGVKMNERMHDEIRRETSDAEDESDGGIRSMIESKLTIQNSRQNSKGEIRINTQLRRTKVEGGERMRDGDFAVLEADDDDEDDDDDSMI